MEQKVRDVIDRLGVLVDAGPIGVETDLYDTGMSSHASVKLMLELEDAFEIEFPDEVLERETFASIQTIVETIQVIQNDA